MCTVSNKIIFCTCAATSPVSLRHYWILRRENKNKEIYTLGEPHFPDDDLYLFDHHANKLRLERRLNDVDAFDFDVTFKPKDRFEIVLNNHLHEVGQRVTYYFTFNKGEWQIEEEAGYFDSENDFDAVKFGKLKYLKSSGQKLESNLPI